MFHTSTCRYLGVVLEIRKDKKEFYLKGVLVFIMIMCIAPTIFTVAFTDIRPLAVWCWIGCDEPGIAPGLTNNGKCYFRILALYAWAFADSVLILVGAVRIYMALHEHQLKNLEVSRRYDPFILRAQWRTLLFLVTYALQGVLNNSLRTYQSLVGWECSQGFASRLMVVCFFLPRPLSLSLSLTQRLAPSSNRSTIQRWRARSP